VSYWRTFLPKKRSTQYTPNLWMERSFDHLLGKHKTREGLHLAIEMLFALRDGAKDAGEPDDTQISAQNMIDDLCNVLCGTFHEV